MGHAATILAAPRKVDECLLAMTPEVRLHVIPPRSTGPLAFLVERENLALDPYVYELIYIWPHDEKAAGSVPAAQKQLVPHSAFAGRSGAARLRHHAGRAGAERREGAALAGHVVRFVETSHPGRIDRRIG